jgi:hypothetical protein
MIGYRLIEPGGECCVGVLYFRVVLESLEVGSGGVWDKEKRRVGLLNNRLPAQAGCFDEGGNFPMEGLDDGGDFRGIAVAGGGRASGREILG